MTNLIFKLQYIPKWHLTFTKARQTKSRQTVIIIILSDRKEVTQYLVQHNDALH